MITITNPRRDNGPVLERCSGQTDNRRRSCPPPAMGHDAKDVARGRPVVTSRRRVERHHGRNRYRWTVVTLDSPSEPPADLRGDVMTGLFDGFEGYRVHSDADVDTALRSALVAGDANVLLNLYLASQGRLEPGRRPRN